MRLSVQKLVEKQRTSFYCPFKWVLKILAEPIYTVFIKQQLIQVGNTASERGIQQPI